MLIQSPVYTLNQACYFECSQKDFHNLRIFNSMFKYESSMLFMNYLKGFFFFKTLIIGFTFGQVIT